MTLRSCKTSRAPRVFLGTVEIAGFYGELAAGLRELGIDCAFVELTRNRFSYAVDSFRLPIFVRWVRGLAASVDALLNRPAPARMRARLLHRFMYFLRVVTVLPWAIFRFDVFCFGFLSNIVGDRFGYWDLAVLRALGKRVICVFHGADSRPPYLTGPYVRLMRARGEDWALDLCRMARERKRKIAALDRLADVVVDGPARGHFHEKRYVAFPKIGLPVPAATLDLQPPLTCAHHRAGATRILHAPSDRGAKGSDVIGDCIKALRQKGHDIDYVELSGVPHDEVLRQIAECDLVIDQIYADGAMAGLATEAAALGKPSIVCGYFDDRRWIEGIPTHYCHPDGLEASVVRMVSEPEYRHELGARARDYVRTVRSRRAVAERMFRVITGSIPDDWWLDPAETTYLRGGGQSEDELKDAIRTLVDRCGASALQLDDKPALRRRMLSLIDKRPAAGPAGDKGNADGLSHR